ncbi:MAG: type II secretion system GspH family protein [Phycisphaerae bacterium]|nr:type II secretion system GspH family protein [Phycisphaerae bacterium]
MKRIRHSGFTIIELLVVVSIIALLVGILLPAIGKARDQAKVSISQSNLRNLAVAHASYAAEWSDRQLTYIVDNASTYGNFGNWFSEYATEHGSDLSWNHAGNHTPVYLGWGHTDAGDYVRFMYSCVQAANASLVMPIVFEASGTTTEYFGSFRLPNGEQFAQYVSGKFYDKTFYAPKDKAVVQAAAACFESPDDYCTHADVSTELGAIPAWASYCLSPAAMYNPAVMAHDDPNDDTNNGWQDPWNLPAGFRSPAMSQARYPNLKTHMLEHHWLQNAQQDCNGSFEPGTYAGCEPYYFNHAWESSPMTLFYDGHVEGLGTRKAMRADGRMRAQTGEQNWGLWSKDTPWGDNGYLIEFGYDQAATSYHILTTDGILGRDVTGG